MVFSAAACVAESAYEPHVTYTGSGWCLSSSVDYKDGFYDYFTERFNMDFIPYFTDLDTNDEKVSLLVNTASMPDGLLWMSFSYDSYIEWVDQGLLKPLPEGWEEKYPDLYHNLQMTGVLDKITIDGQVYVIPHSVWNNFVDISVPVAHHYVYYRKDWAKQLGYEFDDTVSITELLEFCRKAIDANLGETGKTVGLTSGTDTMAEIFFYPHGYNYKRFSRTDDGYVWSPSIEGYTDVIAEMRGYYQEGVLDPDYYLGNSMDSFSSGNAAAYYYQGAPYSAEGVFENFYNSHPALIAEHEELLKEDPAAWLWQTSINDYIGLAVLTDKNDTPFATGCSNFWSATIFNPDLDDETFDRILALTDWLSGKEGEVAVRNGIPEVDWKWTNDEHTAFERIAKEDGTYPDYPSHSMLCNYAMCGDEMSLLDPEVPQVVRDFVPRMYKIKESGTIVPNDVDYSFFVSDSKSNYSVDTVAKITELVVDGSKDIATEWANFIEENKGMVDPLLKDLNAAFFGK